MSAVTAAIIAGTVLAAAGTTAQAVEANQTRQNAKGLANDQMDRMNKAAIDAKAESDKATNTATADAMRDSAKARQQQLIGGAMGRGSTILTGGLGLSQPASTTSKSLLGM